MDERVISYYLLCTAANGGTSHVVNKLPGGRPESIFTKKETGMFFQLHEGLWIAREHAVGGANQDSPADR